MTAGASSCPSCDERSAAGEFKAGRTRMMDGLEQTGGHASPDGPGNNYSYFKCANCGQRWILSEDTSVRGPARLLSRRRD